MPYYYTFLPYERGQIFSRLTSVSYRAVLSLDIGDGETSSALHRYTEGRWEMPVLLSPEKGKTKIPTRISYTGGEIRIGNRADGLHFSQHFKKSPHRWNKHIDGRHTAKEMMYDFTVQYLKQLYEENEELREIPGEELLICVGCPADPGWMLPPDKKSKDHFLPKANTYRKLLEQATGHPNIMLTSEATAAIMHAIFTGQIDPAKGVAVYDLGSSTTDFIYIYMGVIMITRSISLGGHAIDDSMVLRILENNGRDMSRLPEDQQEFFTAQVCAHKEYYYSHPQDASAPVSLYLLQTDSQGRTIPSALSTSLPGDIEESLEVELNRDLMQTVLQQDKFLEDYPLHSWLPVMKRFFQITKEDIGNRPCQTVLLTGGTSHISEVFPMAKEVYSDTGAAVFRSSEPSASVALGMCLSKGREFRAAQELEGETAYLEYKRISHYEAARGSYAKTLSIHICDSLLAALKRAASSNVKCKAEEIAETVARELEKSPLPSPREVLLREAGQYQEDVHRAVNNFSKILYQTEGACQLRLSDPKTELKAGDMTKTLSLEDVIRSEAMRHTVFSSLSRILTALFRYLFIAVGSVASIFTGAFEDFTDEEFDSTEAATSLVDDTKKMKKKADDAVAKAQFHLSKLLNRSLSPRNIRQLLQHCSKEDLVQEILPQVTDALDQQPAFRQSYDDLTADLFEIALGQILLMIYSEPTVIKEHL